MKPIFKYILAGLFGGTLVLGSIASAGFGVVATILSDKSFAQSAPGWDVRLRNCPWDLKKVTAYLDDADKTFPEYRKNVEPFKVECVVAEYKERGFKSINRGGWVNGEHLGTYARVGFAKGDPIGKTAFGHELGHEYLESRNQGDADPAHAKADFWNSVDRTDARHREKQ